VALINIFGLRIKIVGFGLLSLVVYSIE